MTFQGFVAGVVLFLHVLHDYAPEILACWGALTWTLSMIVRRLDQNTRVHAFFQTLIALGINGPAALAWFREWLEKPMPPTRPRAGAPGDYPCSSHPADTTPRDPPAVSYVRRPRGTCLLDRVGVAVGIAPFLAACSWLTPDHVRDVTDADATAICIVVHLNEPPAQILNDCKDATAKMITDLLAARRIADAERMQSTIDTVCAGHK